MVAIAVFSSGSYDLGHWFLTLMYSLVSHTYVYVSRPGKTTVS